jgi:AIG2-like family
MEEAFWATVRAHSTSVFAQVAEADGNRTRLRRGAPHTGFEDRSERVFVVLYDITETDAQTLDSWDRAALGYYCKLKVRAETRDGDMLAWLYLLDA